MNPHFFTAPFYFAFIWFRVQGSRLRVEVAASPQLYMWAKPDQESFSPLPLEGNAIKLSGRTFLAPHRGSCPKG